MNLYNHVMDFPSTAQGWAQLMGAITVVAGAWTGAIITIAKRYIDQTVGNVVRESIDAAMQPVQLQLITMNGELVRVRKIEAKIENGLTERQERIEKQVDKLVEHLMDERLDG